LKVRVKRRIVNNWDVIPYVSRRHLSNSVLH
jgi:hypothetical protein